MNSLYQTLGSPQLFLNGKLRSHLLFPFMALMTLASYSDAHACPEQFFRVEQTRGNSIQRAFLTQCKEIGPKLELVSNITEPFIFNKSLLTFSFNFLSESVECQKKDILPKESHPDNNFSWRCQGNTFYIVPRPNQPNLAISSIKDFMVPYRPFGKRSLSSRVKSKFGDYRKSYSRKHLHSGVDISMKFNEKIYSIGNGLVIFVSNVPNDSTIIIQHELNNKTFYSKYVHVGKTLINAGDRVTTKEPIALAMAEREFKKSNIPFNHLHLEIRKDFLDNGRMSSRAKTLSELNENHLDPLTLLKEQND